MRGKGCWIGLGLLVLVVLVILWPVIGPHRPNPKAACLSNLKQLALGTLMYAQDYGERLPQGRTWMDGTAPYVKPSRHLVHCPADNVHKYSYAMNSALSGMKLPEIAEPEQVILLYESDSGLRNAAGDVKPLADPKRHRDGLCFVFADSHVEFIRPSAWVNLGAMSAEGLTGRTGAPTAARARASRPGPSSRRRPGRGTAPTRGEKL